MVTEHHSMSTWVLDSGQSDPLLTRILVPQEPTDTHSTSRNHGTDAGFSFTLTVVPTQCMFGLTDKKLAIPRIPRVLLSLILLLTSDRVRTRLHVRSISSATVPTSKTRICGDLPVSTAVSISIVLPTPVSLTSLLIPTWMLSTRMDYLALM